MFIPLHDQNNAQIQVTPWVAYGVIGLTVLIYLYQYLLELGSSMAELDFALRHGLVPTAFLNGAPQYTCRIPLQNGGGITVPVDNSLISLLLMPLSYIFLHAGWLHLIGNLWFFWIFADNVEERLGLKFLPFYLATGFAGGILHLLLNPGSSSPLVGASGAISGLMGAYIVLFPKNRITSYFCPVWFFIRRIDVPAWIVLGFYLLVQFVSLSGSRLSGGGVAFDCHLGGFLAGMLLSWPFRPAVVAAAQPGASS